MIVIALAGGFAAVSLCAQEVRRAEPVQVLPEIQTQPPRQQTPQSAQSPEPVQDPAPTPSQAQSPAVAENDLARFLAGVPLPDNSPLAALQDSRDYKEHVKALAVLSRRYDENYFSKMRAWSAAELTPRIPMNRPVYYFFGGPDAVSAMALFPEAPAYILGGLEPVGVIAPPLTLTPEALAESLANLRKSMEVILSYGHFITKDMKTELDRTDFRGVLPVMYAFIAMTGGEIVSASYIGVSPDGGMRDYGYTYTGGKNMLPGIKIVFRRSPGADPQALLYVAANVADDELKANDGVLKWAGGFGGGNVYLKAASHLMHEPYFSRIRTFLLTKGAAVLQDDSGIPFRFFQDGNWRCWFFGMYTGTLDIFKEYHQADLQAAFSAAGTTLPLPFGTGYKWRKGESNLMLAVRQQAPRAEPAQ